MDYYTQKSLEEAIDIIVTLSEINEDLFDDVKSLKRENYNLKCRIFHLNNRIDYLKEKLNQ